MKKFIFSKWNNLNSSDHVSKRNTRLLLSVFTSVMARFVAIGSTLITMPLTLNYLGVEGFGVWMVISGVVGFIAFSDLGIGMGLQNALSKAYGQNDAASPKHFIINAYLIVTLISLLLVLLLFVIFAILPVESLFKINDSAMLSDALLALKYSVITFLLGVPAILIQRILGGIQKTYVANNVMLVGSVVSLFSIFTAVYFDLGLVWLTVLFVASPALTFLVYSLYFFYMNRELRPSLHNVSDRYVRPIVSAGFWTVFTQVIYTVKMNVPTMMISASLGLLAVAEYSVVQKLTALASSVIGMALQPLWVVYGEAYHKGDKEWIQKTLTKSIKVSLLLTIVAAILFQFVGQMLIEIWMGGELVPTRFLIASFSLWMIASTVNVAFSMLLNGTGNFKRQSIYSFVCVGLMLVITQSYSVDLGLSAVVLSMFLIAEMFVVVLNYFEAKRILNGI